MEQQISLDEQAIESVTSNNAEFLQDVIDGLSSSRKTLPCKYFYDERGSTLFEQICEQPEYYLTRSELEIMQSHVSEMAELIGPEAMVVEFGSGSGIKTRLLLESLIDPSIYVPIDVSKEHLNNLAAEMKSEFLCLEVSPLVADFTKPFSFPETEQEHSRRVVYFPGSTIGNFTADQAMELLNSMSEIIGENGLALIGIDLKKDAQALENAYNDRAGVTAAFNLNLLHRIRDELNGEINIDNFEHQAIWNEQESRIEMHLKSLSIHTIKVGRKEFSFQEGESILTEYSHKYSIKDFQKLASHAGFEIQKIWSDKQERFAVLALECPHFNNS